MPAGLKEIFDVAASIGWILGFVFYGSIVLWTYKDARRRIEDPILVATAVATSMLPIVGVFVYMLLRPPEYLADVRERELEIRAMERQLGRQERCPYCRSHIEGDYLSCPVCMTKLRQGCEGCAKPLDPRWAMCPHCETEVRRREVPATGRPGGGRDLDRPVARDKAKDAPRKDGGSGRRGAGTSARPSVDRDRDSKRDSKRDNDRDRDRDSKRGSDDPIRTEPFQAFRRGSTPNPAETTQTFVTPGPKDK